MYAVLVYGSAHEYFSTDLINPAEPNKDPCDTPLTSINRNASSSGTRAILPLCPNAPLVDILRSYVTSPPPPPHLDLHPHPRPVRVPLSVGQLWREGKRRSQGSSNGRHGRRPFQGHGGAVTARGHQTLVHDHSRPRPPLHCCRNRRVGCLTLHRRRR